MSNTEIMVKEALMGAEGAGAEVQFVRLHDLTIKPCTGCNSCVVDLMERNGGGKCTIKDDDFPFIDNLIMDCDGLIVGSPIYEKSPSGQLKSLNDRMGPSHDVGFRMIAQKMREEKGITTGTGPDPRA
jgi:multimeric flavodoxin WrbA